jgi:hypothetical protein
MRKIAGYSKRLQSTSRRTEGFDSWMMSAKWLLEAHGFASGASHA